MDMPAKKAVNVSLRSDLLAQAREAGLNLSALLEAATQAELKKRREAAWQTENAPAIAEYNAWIESKGAPLAESRKRVWAKLGR